MINAGNTTGAYFNENKSFILVCKQFGHYEKFLGQSALDCLSLAFHLCCLTTKSTYRNIEELTHFFSYKIFKKTFYYLSLTEKNDSIHVKSGNGFINTIRP